MSFSAAAFRTMARNRLEIFRYRLPPECQNTQQRGGNIYGLQQVLGHDSIKTTKRYLAYLAVGQPKQAKYGVAQKASQ